MSSNRSEPTHPLFRHVGVAEFLRSFVVGEIMVGLVKKEDMGMSALGKLCSNEGAHSYCEACLGRGFEFARGLLATNLGNTSIPGLERFRYKEIQCLLRMRRPIQRFPCIARYRHCWKHIGKATSINSVVKMATKRMPR